MKVAALGIETYVCVSSEDILRAMLEGLEGIRREFEANGSEEDKICARYVLDGEAGSCDRVFPNGNLKLDCDASGAVHSERLVEGEGGRQCGMKLADFVAHPKAQMAELTPPEVAALRIYTTAAFKSINGPLRDQERRARNEPHPLFLTVILIAKAVLKLRAVGAESEDATKSMYLYRGMQNVELPERFLAEGGTEVAPMSTTSDVSIALAYSASKQGVLFRLRTSSSMERGADVNFLSAFPGEREVLYPPLTYLQPVKPVEVRRVTLAGAAFDVVEVEPKQ